MKLWGWLHLPEEKSWGEKRNRMVGRGMEEVGGGQRKKSLSRRSREIGQGFWRKLGSVVMEPEEESFLRLEVSDAAGWPTKMRA